MDILDSWREEKRSAYLYAIMAESERNMLHRKLFHDLKIAADKQAASWEKKMQANGIAIPEAYTPDFRTRLVSRLILSFGADTIHSILSAMKIRGMSLFTSYHTEHKHTSLNTTSNLRAAVFGVTDGLVSNMSLILGIAAANTSQHFIVLAGVAGLLAGACSMGAGEFISVRTQREVFEYQIEIEKQELAEYPEEEMEELSLIYQARGIPQVEADHLAKIMIDNPDTGLNTLAREELGLNPEDLVSPVGAMISSFLSFSLGAAIPLLPFVFSRAAWNLYISMGITAAALFFIGSVLSLFTNRNPIILGLRMLTVGIGAGAITFTIGKLLGVSL